jgi:hypothetical protein
MSTALPLDTAVISSLRDPGLCNRVCRVSFTGNLIMAPHCAFMMTTKRKFGETRAGSV